MSTEIQQRSNNVFMNNISDLYSIKLVLRYNDNYLQKSLNSDVNNLYNNLDNKLYYFGPMITNPDNSLMVINRNKHQLKTELVNCIESFFGHYNAEINSCSGIFHTKEFRDSFKLQLQTVTDEAKKYIETFDYETLSTFFEKNVTNIKTSRKITG